MRRTFVAVLAVAAAIAAGPALAQGKSGGARGGGGGGGGGGMSGGAMRGPPMTVPGRTSDPRGAAGDIASQRGQFGRDFAQQRRMSQAEQAQFYRERAQTYRAASEGRRIDALERARLAREGRMTDGSAKAIRDELKRDMTEWRDAFQIDRALWQGQRDQWLADKDSLSPEQWAERRATWFAARDRWIAQQTAWAQSNRTN